MELLEKVKPFKNKEKTYELDVIASLMDHSVVRLPPYHCQYNPNYNQIMMAKIDVGNIILKLIQGLIPVRLHNKHHQNRKTNPLNIRGSRVSVGRNR